MCRIARFVTFFSLVTCCYFIIEVVGHAQSSNTWIPAGQMMQPRTGAAAVLLSDERILITGGSDSNGVPQASTEVYDPSTGTFSATPSMNVARANHAAILLTTGDVLVTGGLKDAGGGYSDTAEVYSFTSQKWTLLEASLGTGLAGHAMAGLSDGNVLIVGGASTAGPVTSLLLFKPSDQSISPIGTMLTPRTDTAAAQTPDGRVLIAGGKDINGAVLASTEIFAYSATLASGAISAGPTMTYPRTDATATATYDGVAVIGGNDGSSDLGTAEIFSQWSNVFRVVAGGTPRSHHVATLLPHNGAILAMGGSGGAAVNLLQPWANNAAGAFIAAADSLSNHAGGIAAPGNLGSLLAAGEQTDSASAAELYWFPTISTDQADYPPGTPVVMTGTGFQPGETVDLHMHIWSHQSVTDPADYFVPADDTGSFLFNGYAPNITDLGARYHLTAIGESSGFQAQTVFTDGNPDNTSVSVSCAPNPVPTIGTTCTAEVDNIQASAPNGYPQGTVKFALTTTGSTGTFTPASTCTLGPLGSTKSNCSVTFTPTNNTGGTIKAQYNANPNNWNNGNATVNYTLSQVATSLAVFPVTGTYGSTVSLSTTLTANGTGVSGKSIVFSLNGGQVGTATTDANGVAMLTSVSLSGINVGTYSGAIVASFAADTTYLASSGSNSLTVNQATAIVTLSNLNQTYTGTTLTPTATTSPVGLTIAWTGAPQTNAGTYSVTATVSDPNYTGSASGSFAIAKANATIDVTPYSVTYDGNVHTATGTAKGVKNEDLIGLLTLSGTSHTDASDYPGDSWNFAGNNNYNSTTGTVHDAIAKANATIDVTPYSVTYDGNVHTATGTAKGVKGEDLTGLNLSGTTHTNAGTYATDPWTLTDVTGNYNNASGTVNDAISKANANTNVTPYNATYDGKPHTATGTATGAKGEELFGLDLSNTNHTNAGTYASDSWSFTDLTGNYNNASGTVADSIARANANVTVTPYSVTYDGKAHAAAGTATGVNAETLTGLDLTQTAHTDAGSFTDTWTFTDSTGNYNNAAGNLTDAIHKAPVTATAGSYSGAYDGSSHPPSDCKIVSPNALGYIGGLACTNSPVSVGPDVSSGAVNPVIGGDNLTNFAITSVNGSWSITKANANVSVTGYSVTYDGNAHTATGSATGIKGETLSGIVLSSTTHTNAGTYTDTWTFTDTTGNYNNGSGTSIDSIAKANANVTVTPYSVIWDGNEHKATGTSTGVKGEAVSGLDLSKTAHTNAGSFTDSWTFADVTGNYNNTFGTVNDSIKSWTVTGFYSPVVPTSIGGTVVWNTIKGGSTVPLKFNIYAGTVQKTSTAAVQAGSIVAYRVNCIGGAVNNATDILEDAGATALRFDTMGLQFIQNWKTPKGAGMCYVALMTAADGSTLQAYFMAN